MNISRNEVQEFYYASTLDTSAQAIVPAYSTAAADKIRKVRITDLVLSCGGSARTIRISGQGGNYKDLVLALPANSVTPINFEVPYPLDAVSSTGATRAVYASAAGTGVNAVICGYIEQFD